MDAYKKMSGLMHDLVPSVQAAVDRVLVAKSHDYWNSYVMKNLPERDRTFWQKNGKNSVDNLDMQGLLKIVVTNHEVFKASCGEGFGVKEIRAMKAVRNTYAHDCGAVAPEIALTQIPKIRAFAKWMKLPADPIALIEKVRKEIEEAQNPKPIKITVKPLSTSAIIPSTEYVMTQNAADTLGRLKQDHGLEFGSLIVKFIKGESDSVLTKHCKSLFSLGLEKGYSAVLFNTPNDDYIVVDIVSDTADGNWFDNHSVVYDSENGHMSISRICQVDGKPQDVVQWANDLPSDKTSDGELDLPDHGGGAVGYNPNRDKSKSLSETLKKNPLRKSAMFVLDDTLCKKMYAGELENWEVFLHPNQIASVEMAANGPVMITGTAGTGKTVVAVHRAKWLLDNNKIGAGRKVLFTTYTRTLIDSARSMLAKICTHGQVERVDVINLDELLRKEWAKFRKGGKIEYTEGGETGIIGEVVDAATGNVKDLKWAKEFIAEEYEKVILENGITTLEEYEQVTRPGLLRKISKKSRQTLWPFFALMNDWLRKDECKKLPRLAVLNLLTEAIRSGRYRPEVKYDSIIVDEAQDFGAPEYRFVAAITGNTYSNPRPDSLYIVGDGYQRIYGRNGSLKECQINVHSRSRHLTVCYRSTKRIREYAQNIIAGIAAPNMNGDPENMGNVLSLETGEYPLERFFANKNYGHMKHFMAAKIKSWHGSGICYKDIAILVRNAGTANNPEKYLFGVRMDMEELGIPASIVSKKHPSLDGDTVKIMTMHRAKGLQFISVIIDLSRWPHKIDDADEEQQAENLKQEKLLLYMSVMRATTNVVITGVKGRPQELPVFVPEKCIEDEPPQALPAQPIEQVSGSENLSIYDKFIAYLESIKRGFGIARQYRREISAPLPEDIMARASAISSYNKHEGDLAADWAYFAKKNAVTLTLREAAKMSARNEN